MRIFLSTFALLIVLGGTAFAKPSPAPSKQDLARATALVDQAVALFRAERYTGAAELFLEAYAASRLPVQLRNAAKAFELAGDETRALETWRQYAADPALNAAERGEANAEVARIEEKQTSREAIRAAEEAAARAREEAAATRAREEAAATRAREAEAARAAAVTATSTNAAASKEDPARPTRSADQLAPDRALIPAPSDDSASGPLYLAGGSAIAAIAATILYVHSSSRLGALDEALAVTDGAGKITGIDRDTAGDRLGSINTERNAAAFALSAGAAALTTAAVWWLIDRE